MPNSVLFLPFPIQDLPRSSLFAAERRRLPESKGDVSQKEADTVDYCDAEGLRVR